MSLPPWTLGALLFCLTAVCYLPAILHGGFIWDDPEYILNNSLISSRWQDLVTIWTPVHTPQYYPLVFTSFWLEHNLWGTTADGSHLATGYHITNVLIHALNGILVWKLFQRIGIPWAWLAGAIFALHPMHVESVAWITERKNVLSGMFYLLAAHAYLEFEQRRGADAGFPRESRRWYAVALGCFMLGLLSKTVISSLPAALILVFFYQRRPLTLKRLAPLVPVFVLGAGMGLFTAWIERNIVGYEALESELHTPLLTRLLISGHTLVFYPLKLLFPTPIIFNYPRWDVRPDNPVSRIPLLCLLAVAGFVLFMAFQGRRGPFVALSFFAGTIFPAMGIVFVYPHIFSYVADHFCYLASLGIVAIIVSCLARMVTSTIGTQTVAAAVLIACGSLTWLQSTDYENEEHLWQVTLARNPASWMACNNLGAMHLLEGERELRAGRIAMARPWLEMSVEYTGRAVALKPHHHKANLSRGHALFLLGRHAESLRSFEAGLGLIHEGYRQTPEKLRLFPLAMFHDSMGLSCLALGRPAEAMEHFQVALRNDPYHYLAKLHLAEMLLVGGATQDAHAHLNQLAAILPPPGVEMSDTGVRPAALSPSEKEAIELFTMAETTITSRSGAAHLPLQVARLRLARFFLMPPRKDFRDVSQSMLLIRAVMLDGGMENPEALGAAAFMLNAAGQHLDARESIRAALSKASSRNEPSRQRLTALLHALRSKDTAPRN